MNNSIITTINCKELFSQFTNKREALTLVYLLVEADDDGRINSSIYALAQQLNMHRQTLTRIINHLCEKGYASWEKPAVTGQRQQLYVKTNVTPCVTDDVTISVTNSSEDNSSITQLESDNCDNTENKRVTTDVTSCETKNVTYKEETKEKKEEKSPAPLKEEKKQKKEENSPSPVRAREKISGRKTASAAASLEQRRQQFIDSLMPYATCYGEEMIRHFSDYWTETNRSQTQMRFEMQPTWSTHLRLARWARNEQSFNQSHNSQYHTHRPTPEDYIREAQLTAIRETEEFIRQAEIRRGGVPPHMPF